MYLVISGVNLLRAGSNVWGFLKTSKTQGSMKGNNLLLDRISANPSANTLYQRYRVKIFSRQRSHIIN